MDFWRFLASSYEGAYLGVRNWAGFRQNAEKAQNYDFLLFLGTKRGVSREDSLENPSG